MQDEESRLPQDWFKKAEADIQTVEILLTHGVDPRNRSVAPPTGSRKIFERIPPLKRLATRKNT
ncbi:MAG: hypothetical protein ACTSSA_14060 [Candidatus Freyarchaeota archaeon]|nr:hypothetical protein [Candidatus Freyarchaeota archaeon]